MPIPDFQSAMRPILNLISDGKEHSFRSTVESLKEHFQLTEDERKKMLPSGGQLVFSNRIGWAKTHLRMAGLLEPTGRGIFKITARGQQVLANNKERVDLKVLREQPGYETARTRKDADVAPVVDEAETPEELIESSYQQIRQSVGTEILQKVKSGSPEAFERLVVELLVKMGYGGTRKDAGAAIGRSGDEGIDGIIKEDRLGLDTIYIQAKRWEGNVSRPEIQKFAGALQGFRAKKGIFITTSAFTKEAADYANKIDNKIILVDGEQLWNFMMDYGLGVSTIATYQIQRIDSDFFSEE